jgi:hypothetical protein
MADAGWQSRRDAASHAVRQHLPVTRLGRVELAGFAAPAYLKLESMQPKGSSEPGGRMSRRAGERLAQMRSRSVAVSLSLVRGWELSWPTW